MSSVASPSLSTSAMPERLIGRFVWKELRRMLGFALGVAALAFGLMLFARSLASPSDIHELPVFLLLFAAFGGGAFVTIGAAITVFAVEREEQTDSFLYSLPRYPLITFAGKLIAVVLLGLLFTLAMAVVGWCVGGFRWPPADVMSRAVAVGLTLLAEATAWGLLCSLLVPRPLLAAVLACATTSFSSQLAIGLSGGAGYEGNDYYEAIPARLALAAVVLLASAWLSRRWMLGADNNWWLSTERQTTALDAHREASKALTPAMAQQTLQPVATATRRGIVWRLVWQTWRESWKTMLAVVVGGLMLMIGVQALTRSGGNANLAQLPLSVFFIPGLCGAMAFRQDHRRGQKQFLAEHAGRPRLVWLVRVAGWALFVALLWAPFVVVAMSVYLRFAIPDLDQLLHEGYSTFSAELQANSVDLAYYFVLNFSLATFTAFALGLVASQLIKSEVLAMGLSFLSSIATLFYCMLIIAWRLPPVWCHLPIIVACLLATYLRAPDWIAGRNTLTGWSRAALALVVPLAVVVLSVPAIRNWQIDSATSQFDAFQHSLTKRFPGVESVGPVRLTSLTMNYEEGKRAAEEVSRQYQDLLREIRSNDMADAEAGNLDFGGEITGDSAPGESATTPPLDATPEQIDRLVELTHEPAVEASTIWPMVGDVQHLLVLSTQQALSDGDLDRAWSLLLAAERLKSQLLHNATPVGPYIAEARNLQLDALTHEALLLSWALAPGQSPERLKQAAADLLEVQRNYPPLELSLIARYVAAKESLDAGAIPFENDGPDIDEWEMALMLDRMPGEHQRARKALDLLAEMSIAYVRRARNFIGEPLRNQLRGAGPAEWSYVLQNDSVDANVRGARQWQTANSSLLASKLWNSSIGLNYQLVEAINQQTELSLERLRLALIAYHLDHGEYPADLKRLAPDYLEVVEVDPFSGEMFQYAPRFYEKSVWGEQQWSDFARQHHLHPLIWSVGHTNVEATESPAATIVGTLSDDENDSTSSETRPVIMPNFLSPGQFGTAQPSQRNLLGFPSLTLPRDDQFMSE